MSKACWQGFDNQSGIVITQWLFWRHLGGCFAALSTSCNITKQAQQCSGIQPPQADKPCMQSARICHSSTSCLGDHGMCSLVTVLLNSTVTEVQPNSSRSLPSSSKVQQQYSCHLTGAAHCKGAQSNTGHPPTPCCAAGTYADVGSNKECKLTLSALQTYTWSDI